MAFLSYFHNRVSLRSSNRRGIENDRRLGEQPAVDGRKIPKRDPSLAQDYAFKVRARTDGHRTRHLPVDILGQCTTAQDDILGSGHVKGTRHFEDPDIG